MSLFTDLKEVLTPYANRIKGLSTDVNTAKEDIREVKAVLADAKIPSTAKYALLDCFNHLAWKDDQGKVCMKNLMETLLTRFEYPSLLSLHTHKSPGSFNDSLGCFEYRDNLRMLISYPFGELPYKYRLEDKYYDFYPIPVPSGATKVIATQDSADIMFAISPWKITDGRYIEAGLGSDWETSPFEYTLPESQQKLYLAVNIKNTSNEEIQSSQFPTSFVFQFV